MNHDINYLVFSMEENSNIQVLLVIGEKEYISLVTEEQNETFLDQNKLNVN